MPVADFPIVADVFGMERAIGLFPRPFSIVWIETPAMTDKTAACVRQEWANIRHYMMNVFRFGGKYDQIRLF